MTSTNSQTITITHKTCKACNVNRPVAEFYPHYNSRDGYARKCKHCSRRGRKHGSKTRASHLKMHHYARKRMLQLLITERGKIGNYYQLYDKNKKPFNPPQFHASGALGKLKIGYDAYNRCRKRYPHWADQVDEAIEKGIENWHKHQVSETMYLKDILMDKVRSININELDMNIKDIIQLTKILEESQKQTLKDNPQLVQNNTKNELHIHGDISPINLEKLDTKQLETLREAGALLKGEQLDKEFIDTDDYKVVEAKNDNKSKRDKRTGNPVETGKD